MIILRTSQGLNKTMTVWSWKNKKDNDIRLVSVQSRVEVQLPWLSIVKQSDVAGSIVTDLLMKFQIHIILLDWLREWRNLSQSQTSLREKQCIPLPVENSMMTNLPLHKPIKTIKRKQTQFNDERNLVCTFIFLILLMIFFSLKTIFPKGVQLYFCKIAISKIR